MALFYQPLETTIPSGSKVTSFGSANVLHPHNEFLFCKGGILPVIGFLIMIIGFIKMTPDAFSLFYFTHNWNTLSIIRLYT